MDKMFMRARDIEAHAWCTLAGPSETDLPGRSTDENAEHAEQPPSRAKAIVLWVAILMVLAGAGLAMVGSFPV